MSAYTTNAGLLALGGREDAYRPASAAIVVWYAFDFVRRAGGTWAVAAAGSMMGCGLSQGEAGKREVGGVGRRRRWEKRRGEGW